EYVQLYGEMLYLLTLIVMVALLSIPIKIGGYNEAIQYLFTQKIRNLNQLFRSISTLSFSLGSILNLATPVIMHSTVENVVTGSVKGDQKNFLSLSIVQGYALSNMWSPFSGLVGL